MEISSVATKTKKPIYCKDCKSSDSFERYPEGDIKGESGRVLWEKWKCKCCGVTTIKPTFSAEMKDG